jgi:hypothetical protein
MNIEVNRMEVKLLISLNKNLEYNIQNYFNKIKTIISFLFST